MIVNFHDQLAVPLMSTRFHGQIAVSPMSTRCKPQPGRLTDHHLLRPTSCPPTHPGHLQDRQLPCPTGRPTNVNSLSRPTNCFPKVNSLPDANLRSSRNYLGQLRDRQLPRQISCPPNVNLLPDVNLRSSQTHPGQPHDRQLPRPMGCPPNVKVNQKPSQTHPDQLRDRQLPRPIGCPLDVNMLPRLTSSLPNVNSLPDVDLRSNQIPPGQPPDRQLPRPTNGPPESTSAPTPCPITSLQTMTDQVNIPSPKTLVRLIPIRLTCCTTPSQPSPVYSSEIQLYTGNYFSNDEVNRATRRYPLILLHLNY